MSTLPIPTKGGHCWQLSHHAHDDWRPHFTSWGEAIADLVDRDELHEGTPVHLPRACVRLLCDGCRQAVGMDGEMVPEDDGIHIDPADLDGWLTGWHTLPDDRHQCPDCPPDEPLLSRVPSPNDRPLIGASA